MTTIPYIQWMFPSTSPLCHFSLLADQPPPEASQQRRDLVRLLQNTLVPPLFHHHPPWAENSYNYSILGWPTFSLATVGLLEALVLDFVVEVALICWLWSVLDCFSLITSPLSMAYSKRSQLLKVLKNSETLPESQQWTSAVSCVQVIHPPLIFCSSVPPRSLGPA